MKVFNWFKKKNYPTNQKFELLIIDEKSREVTTTLGIHPDRKDEIFNILVAAYKESPDLCTAAQKTLRHMNHINEVTYAIMMLHKMHSRNDEHPIIEFLSKLGRE